MKFLKKKNVFLGIVLIMAIPAWFLFLYEQVIKIPADFSFSVEVNSFDNFYDPEKGEYLGEQRSVTQFSYDVVERERDNLIIENIFDVKTISGEPIFSVNRLYGVDRHSAKHRPDVGDQEREGYLFAPRMKGLGSQVEDGGSFDYWHVNYNTPARMEYVSSEELYGLLVYEYQAHFTTDQTEELTGILPGVGETEGVVLDVLLTLWVEPYTGRIVQYTDTAEAFYYSLDTGERLRPWNKFHNNTAPASVAAVAKDLEVLKFEYILFQTAVPIGLLILALLSIFVDTLVKKWKRSLEDKSIRKRLTIPLFFSILILLLTLVSMRQVVAILGQQQSADFQNEIELVKDSIYDRFNIYVNTLQGARGLFDASEVVDRGEWKAYVDSLEIQANYPGIQGLGFAIALSPEQVEPFIEQVRSEGFSDFELTPIGEREEYTSIVYLEPFDLRNRQAFGYDMFSEETRREAMTYARDVGKVAMSREVKLLQEIDADVQSGFLMYEPVYDTSEDLLPEERQLHLDGYVYAPFRMNNFMVGIFVTDPTELGVEIFDGSGDFFGENTEPMYMNENVPEDPLFSSTQTLDLYNHAWTIRFTAPHGYSIDPVRTILPLAVGITGVVLTGVLFILLYTINTRRVQAIRIAEEMTQDLKKFRLAVENTAEHVVITDAEGIVLYANSAAEQTTGYSRQEILGTKAGVLWGGLMSKDFYKDMWNTIKVKKKVFAGEIRNKRKNGSEYTAQTTISPVLDEEGEVSFFVALERDITKEKQIDQAKSEFVSLASHQLRTPLSSIKWFAEMLLAGDAGKLSKTQKEYISEIYVGNERMVELVNALLNVSRIELGTFMVEPKETDIVKVLHEEVDAMKHTIEEKKLKVSIETDDIGIVQADQKMLRIIFQNLVSNAIKYTPEKGSIIISLKQKDKTKLAFAVQDTGYGIPEEQKDKIFSKLFRADNVREHDTDGTGLGLYILKSIVEHLGGKISFVSEEDKGTTFTVIFPKDMKKKVGEKSLS